MIWKPDASRGYHHGNLKEALIRAALELIAAKGPSGFTFAEAARSAGVSPAAPYRHFRDRDELIANVAGRGFELFEATLKAAWKDGLPTLCGRLWSGLCWRAGFIRSPGPHPVRKPSLRAIVSQPCSSC